MHKSLIIAAALLVAPAVSQAKTLDELLVEKGVITKGADSGASNSSASKLYWNKGTRASYTDIGFEAGFALFNQFRYTYFDNDTEETGERDRSSFDVEKARLIISGTAMHNEFSYYTQVDFVGNSDDDGEKSPELKDAYITWHACDWADIGMGQRKTLLSRQYNTSDWKTQFPDRSEASDFFDLGRQAGLWTALTNEENNFTLSAAMYNGESDGEGQNLSGTDTHMTGAVGVRWGAMGEMDAYSEGDVDWTDDTAVNIGAVYAYSDNQNDNGVGLEESPKSSLSVDANVKAQGFSLHGEFFYSTTDPDSFEDEVEPTGFYAQAGYFLIPKKFEIAARYGLIDCDDGRAGGVCSGNDDVNEVNVAMTYFWWKHHLKATLGWKILNESALDESEGGSGEDINSNEWMLQLSHYF